MLSLASRDIAIGLDIGGTKIRCGIVDANGTIIGTPREVLTNAQGPREKIVTSILELLNSAIMQVPENRLRGIGIGCTGPLDIKTGTILECNNLPTMHNYPLKHIVEMTTCKEVRVNNDANAMMLGEAVWGVGRGRSAILGITLGTGIGCAFISNGRIWDGFTGNAGEIWQSPYRDGCIEDYVSGPAIARMYNKLTHSNVSAKEVADKARNGEREARMAFNQFADALAYALAWTINTIDPEVVILGGSVVNAADLYLPRVKNQLSKFITPQAAESLEILTAGLGENSGFIGAATLMFE